MTTPLTDIRPPLRLVDDGPAENGDDDLGAADTAEADPEAPWGINPNTGRPYTMSPEKRKEMGDRLATARRAASGRTGPKAPRKTTTTPKAPAGPDYRLGVLGLLQIPAMALGMASRFDERYGLDAAALTLHAPNIADAVAITAQNDDRIAAALDRLMSVGPYGALATALVPLALQLAANHGKVAPAPSMGILDGEQLTAALEDMAKRGKG